MDASAQIEAWIAGDTRKLRESLDLRHSRKDIALFKLKKAVYLEEDVFKYFYPFCFINVSIASVIIFRKSGVLGMGVAALCSFQYVYAVFAFPIEAWHFHKRAISTGIYG